MNKFKVGDIITLTPYANKSISKEFNPGEEHTVIRVHPCDMYTIKSITGRIGWIRSEFWDLVSTPSELEKLLLTEEDYE